MAPESSVHRIYVNSKIACKSYSVTPTTNSNVSPFSAFSEMSIADDVALYGTPVAIVLYGGGSTNVATAKLSNGRNSIWVYSMAAGTQIGVGILYIA